MAYVLSIACVASSSLRCSRPFALALIVSVAACGSGRESKDSAVPVLPSVAQSGAAAIVLDTSRTTGPQLALPVTVEFARDADLVLSIATTGSVRSEADAKLRFETPGTIDRVLVRPGQHVVKGQVLAMLDSVPFVIALRKAEFGLAEATLRYQDLMIDSVAFSRAPSADRRRSALIRSGLDAANLALQQALLDRRRAVLRAPFDGVADRMQATPGERSDQADASITVVDMQHLRIEAAVLEHDFPLIKEGGVALVSSTASPDQLTRGQIVAVLPMIDSVTRAGRAYVRLTGNGVLRPGMSVDVQLEARRLPKRRLVPARAVIERDGRPLVFVVRNDRAQWVYIQPGRSNRVETEVLPDSLTGEIPVKAGDTIIVMGQQTLTHDAPVKVIRAQATNH
jgi:RND family efflux transporter MFP subunit